MGRGLQPLLLAMALANQGLVLSSPLQGSPHHQQHPGACMATRGGSNYHWVILPQLQALPGIGGQGRHVAVLCGHLGHPSRLDTQRGGLSHFEADREDYWSLTALPPGGGADPFQARYLAVLSFRQGFGGA
jgi:hypothetical protein